MTRRRVRRTGSRPGVERVCAPGRSKRWYPPDVGQCARFVEDILEMGHLYADGRAGLATAPFTVADEDQAVGVLEREGTHEEGVRRRRTRWWKLRRPGRP